MVSVGIKSRGWDRISEERLLDLPGEYLSLEKASSIGGPLVVFSASSGDILEGNVQRCGQSPRLIQICRLQARRPTWWKWMLGTTTGVIWGHPDRCEGTA